MITVLTWSLDENHIYYDQAGETDRPILEVIYREEFKRVNKLGKIMALQAVVTELAKELEPAVSAHTIEAMKHLEHYTRLPSQDQRNMIEFLTLASSPQGFQEAVAWLRTGMYDRKG